MPRFSTGLRNAIAVNYGLGIMMNGGVIRVYGGTRPSSPDLAPGTTELGCITTEGKVFIPGDDTEGAGLLLSHVSPGTLINDGNWRFKGIASGTATWWRWCWAGADALLLDTLVPRVDGLVGTDLLLANPVITPTTNFAIESFTFILPMGD